MPEQIVQVTAVHKHYRNKSYTTRWLPRATTCARTYRNKSYKSLLPTHTLPEQIVQMNAAHAHCPKQFSINSVQGLGPHCRNKSYKKSLLPSLANLCCPCTLPEQIGQVLGLVKVRTNKVRLFSTTRGVVWSELTGLEPTCSSLEKANWSVRRTSSGRVWREKADENSSTPQLLRLASNRRSTKDFHAP